MLLNLSKIKKYYNGNIKDKKVEIKMQLTIDVKESALDKILYLLENLKSDVKILIKIGKSLAGLMMIYFSKLFMKISNKDILIVLINKYFSI